jgi:hypothetical protein
MTPEDLVELRRIEELKYRYVRCLDQKAWDELAACLTAGATASYGGGAHELTGRDAILAFLRSAMGSTSMLTSHRVGQPEIRLAGDGTATGTWALSDVVWHLDLDVTVQGAAFYEDRYVLDGGDWLIDHTGYRRVYEEVVPRSSVPGLAVTAQWWATGGRSQLA